MKIDDHLHSKNSDNNDNDIQVCGQNTVINHPPKHHERW